jgi:hypothetical protein
MYRKWIKGYLILAILLMLSVSLSTATCPWFIKNELYTAQCGVQKDVPASLGILRNDPSGSYVVNPDDIGIDIKYGTIEVHADGSFVYDPSPDIQSGTYVKFNYIANNGDCDAKYPGIATIQVSCKCRANVMDVTICPPQSIEDVKADLIARGVGCWGCGDVTPVFDLSQVKLTPGTYPYSVKCPGCTAVVGLVTIATVDDGVDCTEDSCDEATGTVVHTPNNDYCDNGQFCDGAETCDPVEDCQPGTAPTLDDGVDCTDDSCDEENDIVVHTPNDGYCDDGLWCNGAETCDPVEDCQPGTPPEVTDDEVDCTDDYCDEVTDKIVHTPNNDKCDDDANVCTDQVCDPTSGCTYPYNSAPCDDGALCSQGDTCVNGWCTGVTDLCDGLPKDPYCPDWNQDYCNGHHCCTNPYDTDSYGKCVKNCGSDCDNIVGVPTAGTCMT